MYVTIHASEPLRADHTVSCECCGNPSPILISTEPFTLEQFNEARWSAVRKAVALGRLLPDAEYLLHDLPAA